VVEGVLCAATSDDGVRWTPVTASLDRHFLFGIDGLGAWNQLVQPHQPVTLKPLLFPRVGAFDSRMVEPGPAAILGDHGIVLWYNGVEARATGGDFYRGGQALFDGDDPTVVIERPRDPYIGPDQPWEMTGQVGMVTFTEGLVRFRGRLHLYYGCADSRVGVAIA